ncbi:hypothetical protein CRYUN_Cryun27aG0121000 [Craigia yunnanensis]
MKSRYLEGECRRLGRMLQCFIAENQALCLTLHKGCAFNASLVCCALVRYDINYKDISPCFYCLLFILP